MPNILLIPTKTAKNILLISTKTAENILLISTYCVFCNQINSQYMSEKIFKRKIYERMLQWKQESDGQTALLIKGARRIGKSTIAEEFARREYDSYINIDFQ